MPYTHEDYERDYGPGWPDFYTTPADWSKCKNLRTDSEFATPCWHPHCDCQPTQEKSMAFDFIAFLKAVAAGVGAVVALFLIAVTFGALKLYGVF
jgi:hypothetical protein